MRWVRSTAPSGIRAAVARRTLSSVSGGHLEGC